MFHIKKETDGTFALVGVIDEMANLGGLSSAHLMNAGPELRLDCSQVVRINSIGLKEWRSAFTRLREAGKKLHFVGLSPSLVEQVNYIADFMKLSEIESFGLPFVCESCGKNHSEVVKPADAKSMDPDAMKLPCPSCGKTLTFDEIPDSYLGFLRQS